MSCNVGGMDRNLRIVGSVAAFALGVLAPLGRGGRAVAFGLAGAQLVTALTQYCPLNALLGINTCTRSLPEAATEALEKTRQFAA